MTPKIVTVPYRGLRCRELECQRRLVMVATTRGRTMPLELDPVDYGHVNHDLRGVFVIVEGLEPGAPPTAISPRNAQELGLKLHLSTQVYRAHWSGCTKPERFRRG